MTTTNTTNTTKMTKRDYFNALLGIEAVSANDELTAFINHEIELLDKRKATPKTGERKPTARQKENAGLKIALLANMEDGAEYTITDMVKEFDCFGEGVSSQRVNALVSQMIADKTGSGLTKTGEQPTILRKEVKGVAYFSKIADVEEDS